MGGFVGIAAGLTGVFVEVSGYNSEGELIGKIGVQSAPGALTYGTLVPQ